jgi:hypothetical protein
MADHDDALDGMSPAELGAEVRRLREGIRAHRDQRGDDRCWLDDEKLYALLPEGTAARTHMDFELMYPNCRRFLETRVHPRDRFAWGGVPGGSMLPVLEQAERELPALLLSGGDWQSLLVVDEQPHVERLWMPYGDGRLLLHVIHPCGPGESLYHPHPWASAMRIVEGWYETAYGHGPPDGAPPPKGEPRVVGRGHRYEMVNPEAWHYVRPVGGPAVTVMVTGKPWGAPGNRKGRDLGALPPERVAQLLALFRSHYPKKAA